MNYLELKCTSDAAADSLQQPEVYDVALELQRALKSEQFLAALPQQYRITGEPLFARCVNSVVFTAPLLGDDPTKGEYSGIVKFYNPLTRLSSEFGNATQRFAKMNWCKSKIAEQAFPPVAKTYAYGTLGVEGEQVPWSLEERLPGQEAKSIPNPTVADLLWEKTGAISKSILKIEPSGYGGVFDPVAGRFTESWEGYLNSEIEAANLSQLVASGVLKANQAERVKGACDVLRDLDKRYPAALSHRDLAPHNNILWDGANLEAGAVLGVIDFEQASSVPGAVYEIAMTQWYGTVFNEEILLSSFLRGMGFEYESYIGSQLERDCNAVLMLKLCAHISSYLSGLDEQWDPQREALPRMLEKLSSLLLEASGR